MNSRAARSPGAALLDENDRAGPAHRPRCGDRRRHPAAEDEQIDAGDRRGFQAPDYATLGEVLGSITRRKGRARHRRRIRDRRCVRPAPLPRRAHACSSSTTTGRRPPRSLGRLGGAAFAADVTDPDACLAMAAAALEASGRPDVAVNNAGRRSGRADPDGRHQHRRLAARARDEPRRASSTRCAPRSRPCCGRAVARSSTCRRRSRSSAASGAPRTRRRSTGARPDANRGDRVRARRDPRQHCRSRNDGDAAHTRCDRERRGEDRPAVPLGRVASWRTSRRSSCPRVGRALRSAPAAGTRSTAADRDQLVSARWSARHGGDRLESWARAPARLLTRGAFDATRRRRRRRE